MRKGTRVVIVLGTIAVGAAGVARTEGSADSFFRAADAAIAARSVSAAAAATTGNKGVQTTPDEQHILVSKDVGTERWAIALNADDTITGNVFLCEGSAPAFVWCAVTEDDHNPRFEDRTIVWECFGADSCPAVPCGRPQDWPLVNGRVQLTGAFFLP